jgi:mono/diheme cytochrome c family protein
MLPPPSYHEQRIRQMPVGEIYQIVSNGVRNMAAYATQIPPADRWAIIAYVRALQVSRSGAIDDVPADIAADKGWNK